MIKIAAIQLAASPDVERNLRKAGQFLEAAAAKGARIACLPVLFAYPWFPASVSEEPRAWAEEVGGPVTAEIARLAAHHKIAVVCPFYEKGADGSHYNSAVVFDASGQSVGCYRKAHVPSLPLWEEKHYFAPGDTGFPVFEVEGIVVGVQLCWDNFFPEGFRCLALAGADVVFLPSSAAMASQERWLAMAVSHAIANEFYVVRVNRVGDEGTQQFYGQSFCVRPDGELSTEPLGMNEGILLCDVDPQMVVEARQTWPFLQERRPEIYDAVARPGEWVSPIDEDACTEVLED